MFTARPGDHHGSFTSMPSHRAIRTHKDLTVWREAIELTVAVYCRTRRFPPSERFGLAAQMRRAAVSVASNIAEGAARGSSADFRRFVCMARGSLVELETQIEICRQIELDIGVEVATRASRLGRMLNALIGSLDRARSRH